MRDKTGLAAFMVIGVESSGKLGAGLMFTRDEYQTALGPLGLGFTKGKTKLEIDIQKDAGPSLSLTDSLGMVRAVLGPTELKHTDTGSTEIRAPSSLVLFDEDGNVVWSAP